MSIFLTQHQNLFSLPYDVFKHQNLSPFNPFRMRNPSVKENPTRQQQQQQHEHYRKVKNLSRSLPWVMKSKLIYEFNKDSGKPVGSKLCFFRSCLPAIGYYLIEQRKMKESIRKRGKREWKGKWEIIKYDRKVKIRDGRYYPESRFKQEFHIRAMSLYYTGIPFVCTTCFIADEIFVKRPITQHARRLKNCTPIHEN